ncbi:MAG: repair ATPase, partial [Myxococcaceae bacterium]|nr:repair ATPase [Myxococcaceae bacterium]
PRRVEVPSAPYELPPLAGVGETAPVTARVRFESELGAVTVSNFFVPPGSDRDVVRDGGVFVQTYRKLPALGSVVTVALRFAGGALIETEAEVVYAVEASLHEPHPGFGARLLRLTPAQEGILRRYLLDRDPLVLKG